MVYGDLEKLLKNLGNDQLEIIAGIALRMAEISSERWTGKITFDINVNQGGIGDMHVNRGEVVRIKKTRQVRTSLR